MNRRDLLALGLASLSASALKPCFAWAQGKYPERPIKLMVRVLGRRRERRRRPPMGRAGEAAARHGLCREPGRRQRHDRDRRGRARRAGRPHDPARQHQHDGAQPDDHGQGALRPVKDFVPIAILCVSTTSIVVHASVPAKTLKELIAYAKANPGKLSYGSAGTGTMSNLSGELFKQLTGLNDLVHIPYKGAGPGITDLVSGHIPMMSPNVTGQVLELHRAGKIRILAVNAAERLKAAPDIPTAIEQGVAGHDRPAVPRPVRAGGHAQTPIVDRIADGHRARRWRTPEFQKVLHHLRPRSDPEFRLRARRSATWPRRSRAGAGGQGLGLQGGVNGRVSDRAAYGPPPAPARACASAARSTLLVEASGSSSTNQTKRGCW